MGGKRFDSLPGCVPQNCQYRVTLIQPDFVRKELGTRRCLFTFPKGPQKRIYVLPMLPNNSQYMLTSASECKVRISALSSLK